MSRFEILITVISFFLSLSFGEALKCYHCYDSFTSTLSLGSVDGVDFGEKFVRCDKDQKKWNSWDCPARWPTCVLMSGRDEDHREIIRTCVGKDFCSKYVPPANVKLDYCQECNTTLCNDYQNPDPPVGPGPLFTFNVNIHLRLKKYPIVDDRNAS